MNYAFLKQFEIFLIYPLSLFNLFDISITNSFLYIILAISTAFIVFELALYRTTLVPNKIRLFLSITRVKFIFTMDMATDSPPPPAPSAPGGPSGNNSGVLILILVLSVVIRFVAVTAWDYYKIKRAEEAKQALMEKEKNKNKDDSSSSSDSSN